MRGFGRLVAGSGVLLAVAWCALWVFGRGEIENRLDAGIDAMRDGGLAVEVGARRVSGFPFAFAAEFEDITLTDPRSGVSTVLPALSSRVALDAPDELVTELPERFSVTVPIDPGLRAAVPGLPPRLVLGFETEALELVLPVQVDGGPPRGASVRARRLRISPIGTAFGTDFDLELEGLEASGTLGSPEAVEGGSVARSIGRMRAGRLVLNLDIADGRARRTISVDLADTAVGIESDARDMADLRRLLNGAPEGEGTVTLSSAAFDGTAELRGTGTADGRVSAEGESLSGRFAIARGGIATAAEFAAPRVSLAPGDTAHPVRGAVAAERLAAEANVPLAAGAQMRAVRLAVEAEGLAPDSAVWQRLDPARVLPRAPGHARVEIEGTGRFTKPPASTSPGEALPLELGNLSLSALEIDALGARAEGRGDVEFLQPVNEPRGSLTLRLEGVLALLRRLHEAGLITQEELQSLATLAAFYTRAGDGPDSLVADIDFAPGEIRVNGDRIR